MKDPWVSKIPCCCCWGKSRPESVRSTEKDQEQIREEEQIQQTDDANNQAERAINSALRLSFHSNRSRGGVQDDLPQEEKLTSEPPPPSYDAVLKDDVRRTPRAPMPDEGTGQGIQRMPEEEIQPARRPELEIHDQKLGNNNQESVLSSDDDELVLTPPTTAPPTVIDEDSEDDERFYPSTAGNRSGR